MEIAAAAESQMTIAREIEQGVMILAAIAQLLTFQAKMLTVSRAVIRKMAAILKEMRGQTTPFRMPFTVSTTSDTPCT